MIDKGLFKCDIEFLLCGFFNMSLPESNWWTRRPEQYQKFERLKATAASIQADGKASPASIQAVRKPSSEEINRIAVDYFLSAGLDYKGQNQCCYQAFGGGSKFDIEIDPARLASGVFSTNIALSAEASVLKKTLMIAQVGPSSIGNLVVLSPLMINCLEGYLFQGGVSAEIFAGVSVDAGISFDLAVGGRDASSSIEAGASAGIHASGSLSGNHFYAEDLQPIPFKSRAEDGGRIRDTLTKLMATTNWKAYLKIQACDFINSNPTGWQHIEYDTTNWVRWTSHESTDRICTNLEQGISRNPTHPNLAAAEILLKNLRYYQEGIKPSILTSLQMSSHEANGGAGLTASANAKANALGLLSISVEAKVDALSVTGSYKPINIRYQTAYPAIDKRPSVTASIESQDFVVMTQDTRILYEQYKFVPASLEVVAAIDKHKKEFTREVEIAELNRMTYMTTTVFWSSKERVHPYLTQNNTHNSTGAHSFPTTSLNGTGISFGGSFLFSDLKFALQKRTALEPILPEIAIEAEPRDYISKYTDKVAVTEVIAPEELSPQEVIKNDYIDLNYDGDKPTFATMVSEIKNALTTYEKESKGLFTWQSNESLSVARELKRMIKDDVSRVGDAVAWLINDNGIDDHEFNFKFGSRLPNPDSRFYGILKKHYIIGKTKQEAERKAYSELKDKTLGSYRIKSDEIESKNNQLRDEYLVKVKEYNEKNAANAMQTGKNAQTIKYNQRREAQNKAAAEAWTKKGDSIRSRNAAAIAENIKIRESNVENRIINEYTMKHAEKQDKFLQNIADSLNVTLKQLKVFLNATWCAEMIQFHESCFKGIEAILLEASFEVNVSEITLTSSLVKKKERFSFSSSKPTEEIIELHPDTGKNMLTQFKSSGQTKKLSAIRMRYRIQDSYNKDTNLFKLGFSIFGNGAGIQLKKIEDAGSEGIFDLYTEWFSQEARLRASNLGGDEKINYEQGVPQVALFCN